MTTFPVGDWVGKVWAIAQCGEDGGYVGCDYEQEFVLDRGDGRTHLSYEDVLDLLAALDQTRECVAERRQSLFAAK